MLLVNLGTPASPSTRDVRRYLREFLGDPRVLDMNLAARWLLLNLIILPFRPKRSAEAYAQIWTEEGSPLAVHGRTLEAAVAEGLGPDFEVVLAMRYGAPSLADGLARLASSDVDRILALPLFPQFATATTGSVMDRIQTLQREAGDALPPVEVIEDFYDAPAFIRASAEVAAPLLEVFEPDHVLFSYHGLPEHQITRADPSGSFCLTSGSCCDAIGSANRRCYRAQCFATTRALATALALPAERHSVAFQSRLGRTPWIRPYTDVALKELALAGARRVAVLCPSFVADCLETLEEIGIRGRELFRSHGGEELLLVPCVNAAPVWADGLANHIRARA